MDFQYRVIEGKRRGSENYLIDGFLFEKNKSFVEHGVDIIRIRFVQYSLFPHNARVDACFGPPADESQRLSVHHNLTNIHNRCAEHHRELCPITGRICGANARLSGMHQGRHEKPNTDTYA